MSSSIGPVPATTAPPVKIEASASVTLDADGPEGYPVATTYVSANGRETYWSTPDEALDLAVQLMQTANDARAAAAPRG